MHFPIIDIRKVDSSSGVHMKRNIRQTDQIHDMAAAGLILRILDDEVAMRHDNFIVALDGHRIGINDARNFMVSILDKMIDIS